jgi:NADPH2:quinone reductase
VRAIQITEFGGPEVLRVADLPEPEAGKGQVRIAVTAAGVNYADTHRTDDSYLAPGHLPFVPGAEVAGTDPDGRRVVAFVTSGGYAEVAVASESLTFPVPDYLDDGAALALLLQGATAWHILRTSAHVAAGESVVVHAAAGGVGSLAVQLARHWGAGRVIATASSDEKRRLASELGADATVDVTGDDLKGALEAANGGRKVDVVLEMAGGTVFDASLAALAPFGRLVTYGMASRDAPKPLASGQLLSRSRGVIGFWLAHCMARPQMLRAALDDLFALAHHGHLRAVIGGTYALGDAAQAHADLRARRTTGKLLLDPTI